MYTGLWLMPAQYEWIARPGAHIKKVAVAVAVDSKGYT